MRSAALLALVSLACAALGSATIVHSQTLSDAERKDLDVLSRPESWFIGQIGPREIVDGQRLNAKVQYIYQQRRKAAAEREAAGKSGTAAASSVQTVESREAMRTGVDRAWTVRTKVTHEMASVTDQAVKGRGGDIQSASTARRSMTRRHCR